MKNASTKLLPVGYPVYHAVAQLNRSFEDCIENFKHVVSLKLFNAENLHAYELMMNEVLALTNQELAEVINDRELENSTYYEHRRLEWLRALEGDSEATVPHMTDKTLTSEKRKPGHSKNQGKKKVRP